MPLGPLQHFTIEPSDLERTKDFYCDVLGLENGDRPPLDFPGYWLYSGGMATVHLMGTRKPREGIVVRGTASDQFALNDFFVRSDHSITREFNLECREAGPLYRMSSGTCYQVGFAGVACGIARGALDSFVETARNKVPRGSKTALRDNAVVQSGLAQAEVNLRAARSFVLQSMADVWTYLGSGASITVEQRVVIRMAATHAIHKAREAVDFAYDAAGATAIFDNHPLERRFRDIHTVTQQLQGRLSHFETVGAWMMGAEADLTFV